jgi:GNAT superfamily N-acetyltransferase
LRKSDFSVFKTATGEITLKFIYEEKGIAYKIFDISELQNIALVIGESFSSSEPMAVSQGISVLEMSDLVKQFGDRAAQECLTIVALERETKKIIGVLLANDWGTRSTAEMILPSQKFNPILAILDELDTRYKQGKKIEANEYLHLEFLAVSKNYRGKNIAHNLVAFCLENAISKKYKIAVSTVTNPISHHIHKKLGFQDCFEIPYKTFSYENQKVFASLTDSIVFMDKSLIQP